jgi:hypothetical protein
MLAITAALIALPVRSLTEADGMALSPKMLLLR